MSNDLFINLPANHPEETTAILNGTIYTRDTAGILALIAGPEVKTDKGGNSIILAVGDPFCYGFALADFLLRTPEVLGIVVSVLMSNGAFQSIDMGEYEED